MHEIKLIQTNDGKRFKTGKEALRYLDDRFGEVICPLASTLANITKYSETLNFIEENLDSFRTLIELKDEMTKGVISLDKGE